MSKREKPKTAVDTKTENPVILSAKTEKPISKVTKTAKPKNPMPPPDGSHKSQVNLNLVNSLEQIV